MGRTAAPDPGARPPRGVLVVLAVAALVLAGLLAWRLVSPDASAPVTAPAVSGAPTAPPAPPTAPSAAATTPPASAPAPVPPPERLVVPRLGLDLAVLPTGVAEDGQMALPERLDEAGWYRFGPAPGAATGSAVLAGHVDSRRDGRGPLAALRSAVPGDEVVVRRVDGSALRYAVRSVDVVEKQALPVDELFRREGEPVLRVLTCGGPYSPGTGYRDNVVVTAVPQGPA